MQGMKINELAQQLNISARTIRFYEEKGMIRPAKDPGNGYRLFGQRDALRLRIIVTLREFGMGVEEVKGLLKLLDRGLREEAVYALELQRSAMFDRWMEGKRNLEAADFMIQQLQGDRGLEWEDLFELAGGLKRRRELRDGWRDAWDFDSRAAVHDELVSGTDSSGGPHPVYMTTLRMMVERVLPAPWERGLDAGTGTGNLAGMFAEAGVSMAGIDQSREMLKQCRRKFPQVETRLGNLLSISYMDGSFDFVVSSYALRHLTWEQKQVALSEMKRVLKPHGRICIADLMYMDEGGPKDVLSDITLGSSVTGSDTPVYYARCSELLEWFGQNGYLAAAFHIAGAVHMIYAVPVQRGPQPEEISRSHP
ncbi:MerR family transcriptional regulator [Paenibacillus sp. P96]|uniref:MerR family transcriptional regulator n=1 Tax=Paenibacillus zeirhizosphaerae TaxID=2987519 RepID=A0ABT9FPZ5_9BACL|nr:MerR family transcriptional regulator [Paenibacillus sp. P96]MDP4096797.1 MerR family transcriptional regulator [Paenibacillus sp. P96]